MSLKNTGGILTTIVRHPTAANLVMVAMILFGALGLSKLHTQVFPTITDDTVSVSITWSGASAEDVVSNILDVVEPELRYIDNLDEMVAYAREGGADISLEFVEGSDMQKALSDVEQAVNGITTLPSDSDTPTITASTQTDAVATLAIRGPYSEAALKTFARQIRDDLLERGIDKINLTGYRAPEIVVEVPERELRRLQLSVSDIATEISSNTTDVPAGDIKGNVDRQIRAIAEKTPAAIGAVDVKTLSTGEKTTIADIAHIYRDFDEDDEQGFSTGTRAIKLSLKRMENSDTLKASEILDQYLEEIRPQLPSNLEVLKYNVAADEVKDRILMLVDNGLSGLILVVVILFVFLNARIALWVAAGIPVAMIATFGVMWLFGESINMISLFGLIMMLGVIVDDAIVVGEHTATRLAMGDPPDVAAVRGAQTMFSPVLAAALTTIAAFMPILLISDKLGQVLSTLPVVVVSVVVASLIECFAVLPGHLGHSLSGKAGWKWWRVAVFSGAPALFLFGLMEQPDVSVPPYFDAVVDPLKGLSTAYGSTAVELMLLGVFFIAGVAVEYGFLLMRRRKRGSKTVHRDSTFRRAVDTAFDWVRDNPFKSIVRAAVSYRYVTCALAFAALLLCVGLVQGGRVGFTFFPSPESEHLTASIVFHPGTPQKTALDGMMKIEDALYDAQRKLTNGDGDELVLASFSTLGQAGDYSGDNFANISVQLTPAEARSIRTPEIVRAWRAAVPELPSISNLSIAETRGGPPGRDLDIRLTGAPLPDLKAAAAELSGELSSFPGVSGVEDDLPFGKPELLLELTPRGKALGFTIDSAAKQIRYAFEGNIPRYFAEGDEEVAVRVRQALADVGSSSLRDLSLKASSGEYVPLSEVVRLKDAQGFSVVKRRDGKTVVSVVADVDSSVTSNNQIMAALSKTYLPQLVSKYGLKYEFKGKAEEQHTAFVDLLTGVILAVIAIYIILAAIFGSYSRPIVVMSIIPFGIVGAIFGHYIMGYKLTMLSIIVLLGLSGIVINNSIILVDRFLERRANGESHKEAAISASCDRLRAVFLTSLTTISGLLPLMFETSRQAQFMIPMAITIVFGLAVATVLVLMLVPALLQIGDDFSRVIRIRHRLHEA
ncbi:efflux RND transporter permease subunit [Roseibium sp. RKSG952]|uniref:efflux RND transporter permease subunit n=1 Tax=Roseibium sp. RKSG952 TaxID=2529384 RepID=UPI0012BD485D|nr:efflux RND transporter permease subunit [Roseibium sp. RKSG952]MTH95871.1 efflux RND transporter permease subunit [Roseibium sp. RKSG952]